MILISLETGPLQTNCYILGDEKTKEAAVVDPGGNAGEIMNHLVRNGLTCKMIIITHAHFDHVGGLADLKEKTGAKVVIHSSEKDALPFQSRMAMLFGLRVKDPAPADMTVEEGDVLKIGGIEMEVIHTPGHSPGSICLIIRSEKVIIDGDLLFQGSVGRSDFPGGSHEDLIDNVRRKLFTLGDDWKVYPGHGPATTIGMEKKSNPFF